MLPTSLLFASLGPPMLSMSQAKLAKLDGFGSSNSEVFAEANSLIQLHFQVFNTPAPNDFSSA